MTSILTNTSAMNALQTLKNTNMNLNKTQQEIASGKSIGSARDNAAVWAISKVMDSDTKGFEQISSSLALGQSTIAVARNAAESITDLLTDIKGLVVSAQEDNVDREKIQTDIGRLREQITSIVDAAQFNGLNLVNGSASSPVNILSSLNRAADGSVQAANIQIDLADTDLSGTAGTAITAGVAVSGATIADGAAGTLGTWDFVQATGAVGGGYAVREDELTGAASTAALLSGDQIELQVNNTTVRYTVKEGDTGESISGGLRSALEASGISGVSLALNAGNLEVTNNTGAAVDFAVTMTRGEGGLAALTNMTVAGTDQQRSDALADIETMI